MSFRALSALGLLIFAVGMERCAYYGTRAFLLMDLMHGPGLSTMLAGTVYAAITFLAYAGTFAGGGLAVWLGPRVTAIVGAAIAAIGAFVLAAGASMAGAFVVALGTAIFRPCPYAAAAAILTDEDRNDVVGGSFPSPRRFAALATFSVVAYAGVNVGAMIAPPAMTFLRDARDASTAYGFAGALELLVALAAGVAAALGTRAAREMAREAHAPYRAPAPPPSSPSSPAATTNDAVWGPLTLLGVAFAAMHFVMDGITPDPRELGVPSASWLFTLNPIVVLLIAVPSAALFLVLASRRSPLPLTKVLGVGLGIFALGGLLGVVALLSSGSVALWAVALSVMAAGEAVAFPLGLVYAALAARGRMATMVVAGWIALTVLPAFMTRSWLVSTRTGFAHATVAAVAAGVVVTAAVLVLVYAERLQRQLGDHSKATS